MTDKTEGEKSAGVELVFGELTACSRRGSDSELMTTNNAKVNVISAIEFRCYLLSEASMALGKARICT
eukprot:4136125-Amphidinium_carterae.1